MLGFIYIWFDKKYKKYYIGSHLGTECDGYICSSPTMKEEYEIRPQDFKRRILKKFDTDRATIIQEEGRILSKIKKEKRHRYYNKNFLVIQPWVDWTGRKHSSETLTKMSVSRTGRRLSEEHKEKLRKINKGRRPYIASEETRRKMSNSKKGAKHSAETRDKMSVAHSRPKPWLKGNLNLIENGKRTAEKNRGKPSPRRGTKCSDDTRRKMAESQRIRRILEKNNLCV